MVNQTLMTDVTSLFIDQVTVDWFGKPFLMFEKNSFAFGDTSNFKFQIELESNVNGFHVDIEGSTGQYFQRTNRRKAITFFPPYQKWLRFFRCLSQAKKKQIFQI